MASVLTTDNRFDEYGRAESSTYVIGDRTLEYSVTYKPDSNLVGSITLPASAAQASVGYSYDGFERVTQKKISLSTNKNLVEDYAYYSYNQGEVTRTTPLVSRLTLRDGANVSTVYDYTYDLLGNITQIKKGGAVVSSYEYDSLGQLVRENDFVNTKATLFFYDKVGNIAVKYESPYVTAPTSHIMTMAGSPGDCDLAASYSYSTGTWGDMLTSYNGTTITYDAIGNPKKWRNAQSFTWDGRKLTYFYTDDGMKGMYFRYNADGVRTYKSHYDHNTGNMYHVDYVLDGTKIVSERYTHEITNAAYTLYYFYDAAGSITGFEYNGTPYYFQKNVQGDIIRILNTNGTVVTEYTYDAWGKVLSVTGSLASTVGQINPFRYRGYYYDSETGFYYLQTRYYDPEVGRFLNADDAALIGANGGILGYNLFAYCNNNPLMFSDPTGCVIKIAGSKNYSFIQYFDAVKQYWNAIRYSLRSPTAFSHITTLARSKTVFTIVFISDGDDKYAPATKTIYWDPYSGLVMSDNTSVQSAAVGLFHEMGHAVQDINGMFDGTRSVMEIENDNLENCEWPICKELGEPIRSTYRDASGLRVMDSSTHYIVKKHKPGRPGNGSRFDAIA